MTSATKQPNALVPVTPFQRYWAEMIRIKRCELNVKRAQLELDRAKFAVWQSKLAAVKDYSRGL